jgi:hypothetical protein
MNMYIETESLGQSGLIHEFYGDIEVTSTRRTTKHHDVHW